MSANIERIEEYLDDVERWPGAPNGDRARERILSNYASALHDLEWNHRERMRWRELFYAAVADVQDPDRRHRHQSMAGVSWT